MTSTDDYNKNEIEIQFHHNRAKAVLHEAAFAQRKLEGADTFSVCQDGSPA